MSNKEVMNDSFDRLFDGIDNGMLPPPKLEEAVIVGTYYKGSVYKGTHVRRLTLAIVAYAVGIMLFLGSLFLLPKLFTTQIPVATEPTTSVQQTEVTPPETDESTIPLPTPGALYQKLLTENNVAFTLKSTTANLCLMRDGNRIYQKVGALTQEDEEIELYYDTEAAMLYYVTDKGIWIKKALDGGVTWESNFADPSISVYFEDANYDPVDGIYVANESAYIQLMGITAQEYDGTVQWDYSMQGDLYVIQTIWRDNSGTVQSELRMEISFGTVPTITLPDAQTCYHDYVPTSGLSPTCTEGYTEVYVCSRCGNSYYEERGPIGHEFHLSVCMVCGYECTDHEYEITGSTIYTCELGQSISYSCKYCDAGYYEEIPGTGAHHFVGNQCTGCTVRCDHVYEDGVCFLCDTPCNHDGRREAWASTSICTEGVDKVEICGVCGDCMVEPKPAAGHNFQNGYCTVCREKQIVEAVTDPNVTKGSESLLPVQMYLKYPHLNSASINGMYASQLPVYYNVDSYFEGYTITDIRLPVYWGEEGDRFTIRVMKTDNGINTKVVSTYQIKIDKKLLQGLDDGFGDPVYEIDCEWILFSGLSIQVPEGCTLVFGLPTDTLLLAQPTGGFEPGYCYRNDATGACDQLPLIMDIYGKKN